MIPPNVLLNTKQNAFMKTTHLFDPPRSPSSPDDQRALRKQRQFGEPQTGPAAVTTEARNGPVLIFYYKFFNTTM